jgi:hypothetical protein
MEQVSGRMKGWQAQMAPPVGDSHSLSTGAVFKYATDIDGPELDLPKRLDTRDFILQIYEKSNGAPILTWGWTAAEGKVHFSNYVPAFKGLYRMVVMW